MRLYRPILLLITSIFLFSALTSCERPTYSGEKVKESIIKLCKDEYNLNVKVKIIGSTLGVLIPVDGLVGHDLKLNREAGEKIEDVALSIHRVTMSTDRPLKIYTLTARDTKAIGAEFVLTGYLYDVVRVRLLDISRGEYFKRILRDFRFNPVVAGEYKIREFFKLLNENSPLTKNARPLFYPIYTIGKPGSQRIEIKKILSKELSEKEALFLVKTEEYYKPKHGFEAYEAIFPSGFENEYLFLVNLSLLASPIKEIVPKYFFTGSEIRQRKLEATFNQYPDVGYIEGDGFPKMELTLGWFLGEQLSRRIKTLFDEDKKLAEKITISTSKGRWRDKKFRFEFMPVVRGELEKADEVIYSKIIELVGWVLHRYEFEDFEGVQFVDMRPGKRKIYLTKEELNQSRKGKIKIKDII